MPAGKGRYTVGAKGTHGCKGYPVVGGEGKVHGCHPSKGAARSQQRAIYASENSQKFTVAELEKAMVAIGDFVIASTDDEVYVGRVEHVMAEGSVGIPGSEYYMEATAENPAVVVRVLEFDSEGQYWEETVNLINVSAEDVTKIEALPLEAEGIMEDGIMSEKMDCCPDETVEKQAPCWDGYVQRGMKEKDGKMVPNCVPVDKSMDEEDDEEDELLGKKKPKTLKPTARVGTGEGAIVASGDSMSTKANGFGKDFTYTEQLTHIFKD